MRDHVIPYRYDFLLIKNMGYHRETVNYTGIYSINKPPGENQMQPPTLMLPGDELKPALRLFHPYLGLQNWKYHENLSAFTHSLSTAYHARGLYRVLTRCESSKEKEELAFHAGLVHDLGQKAGELGLDPATRQRLLERAYHDQPPGLTRVLNNIVVNLNLAENPQISIGGDRRLSTALRLADLLQARGVDNLFQVTGLLDPLVQKGHLDYTVYSIGLPQPAVRAHMSTHAIQRAIETVKNHTNCTPHVILTREGAVVVHPPDPDLANQLRPLSLDWDQLRIEDVETQLLEETDESVWSKKLKVYREPLYSKLSATYHKTEEPRLPEEVKHALLNIRLEGVQFTREYKGTCLSCGLPLAEEFPTQLLGYSLYSKAVTEMWNTRYRPHENMNTLYSGKRAPKVCLLCVMDSLLSLEFISRERSLVRGRPRHYLAYTFTKPTPLEVLGLVEGLMRSPQFTIRERGPAVGDVEIVELPDMLSTWVSNADRLHSFIQESLTTRGQLDFTMTDLSTATVFKEAGVYRARDGRMRYLFAREPHKDLARMAPYLGGLLILTQTYPYKIAPSVEPLLPDSLVGLPFNAPLIGYPPREKTGLPPYTASLLASLHVLSEERERLRILEEPPGFAPILLLSLEPRGRHGDSHGFFRVLETFEKEPLSLYT